MLNLSEFNNVHCIGIGGVGVSAIAGLLLKRGYNITGSDMQETKYTKKLSKAGAKIYIGHSAENVEGADLVIYSAAVPESNPEIARAKELNITLATRAEALGAIMDQYHEGIAISGTHGKTTTTSMVSLILENAGMDPTVINGGDISEFGANYRDGNSQYFVLEACEYMNTFLDLRPMVGVILNIDIDHLDFFKNVDGIVNAFSKFSSNIKEGGILVANGDISYIESIIAESPNVVTFGLSEGCDYQGCDIKIGKNGMPDFEILYKNESLGRLNLCIPGEHNIYDALAAFACCHQLGVDAKSIIGTLEEFHGAKRRFDIVGKTSGGAILVDDYAHHPTAIKVTLSAAQDVPHNRVWCVCQPLTYARTVNQFDEYLEAFHDADILIVTEIYSSRETETFGMTAEKLANALKEAHPNRNIMYISSMEDIADKILAEGEENDYIITMGGGDVNNILEIAMTKDQR